MAILTQRNIQFTISSKVLFLRWFLIVLLFFATVCIPLLAASAGQAYPNLDNLLAIGSMLGFIWIPVAIEQAKQTNAVQLLDHAFTVRRMFQTSKTFGYDAILGFNERSDTTRGGTRFNVLTVYLADDFFTIPSNEFADYEQLKEQLSLYGNPLPYRKVITEAYRNRLRWLIGGLSLLVAASIAYGYLAHNPKDKQPAKLLNMNGLVKRITSNAPKGFFKGVFIELYNYPAFTFYISRKSYDTNIQHLVWDIEPNRPITLRIRESDYRKKIAKTDPLTFGDKYDNYKQIMVFGVEQPYSVVLETSHPILEPAHTNPLQRTILSSILLLLCWTAWVYVDQLKVLRPH
jgi:hypothetical protein